MRIHTKKTGKETLIITPLPEGYEKGVLAKKLQNQLDKHEYFTGKEEQTILKQGKIDELIMGIGKPEQDEIRKFGARAAQYARDHHYTDYAIDLTAFPAYVQAGVEGSLLGLYTYDEYKKRGKDEPQDPTNMTIIAENAANKAIKEGKILAESIILARNLTNRPANKLTPIAFATLVQDLGKTYGFNVKVLGKKELEKLGMGGILAVSQGSDKDPQVVIMEVGKGKEAPIALAGKGITFDAGGLQVKPASPAAAMDEKIDMGGAATVVGTIVALARLGTKKHIVGAIGLSENVIGPAAYKMGDIITMYTGLHVEVQHTDAEGRLVLADLLGYLEKNHKPEQLIDLATLTGAAIITLGYRIAPFFSENEDLITSIKEASKQTDELVWHMPLANHYRKDIEASNADIGSMGKEVGYIPGPRAIMAATFLERFVKKTPWAHIDMAGTGYTYDKAAYHAAGATGWGVRLLTKLINR